MSLWRILPQICKQGRIHLQIIVYLFPSRRREAADGGADTDCGFILDERNGVDWSVDTGHIWKNCLLDAERRSRSLTKEARVTLRIGDKLPEFILRKDIPL